MTATNTPTPELVERLRKEIPYNADGFRELRDLADEAAAAIAKLTAERDALRLQLTYWITYPAREAYQYWQERAEAAEKRAKELESDLRFARREADEIRATDLNAALNRSEAANNLLSERVAVLENALEPFADEAKELAKSIADDTVYSIDGYEVLGFSEFTVGDLRRALAAREAK